MEAITKILAENLKNLGSPSVLGWAHLQRTTFGGNNYFLHNSHPCQMSNVKATGKMSTCGLRYIKQKFQHSN